MKHILLLCTAIVLGTAVSAQQNSPGSNFISNWDMNDDGQVSLAEATERRGDIFTSFDEDDDGFLSADEYATFEEAQTNTRASNREAMQESGQGQGKGQGRGQGRGQGHNQHDREGQGMTIEYNDIDSDGRVSRDEFMIRTPSWYATMDRNGDGTVSSADFGRGRN